MQTLVLKYTFKYWLLRGSQTICPLRETRGAQEPCPELSFFTVLIGSGIVWKTIIGNGIVWKTAIGSGTVWKTVIGSGTVWNAPCLITFQRHNFCRPSALLTAPAAGRFTKRFSGHLDLTTSEGPWYASDAAFRPLIPHLARRTFSRLRQHIVVLQLCQDWGVKKRTWRERLRSVPPPCVVALHVMNDPLAAVVPPPQDPRPAHIDERTLASKLFGASLELRVQTRMSLKSIKLQDRTGRPIWIVVFFKLLLAPEFVITVFILRVILSGLIFHVRFRQTCCAAPSLLGLRRANGSVA